MAVNELRFAGSEEAPSKLSEVFSRRPILGTGERPKALVKLAERKSIYVETKDQQKPKVDINPVPDMGMQLWRIDVPLSEKQDIAFVPGKTARREKSEVFLKEIDESLPVSGFRPPWPDVLFAPRPTPQREFPSLTRLNGMPVQPLRVFGADDRWAFRDASWPWGLVGRITNNRGSSGTGVLVGERLVVTAGHLVPWGDSPWRMHFVPAYYDGVSLLGRGVESYVSDARGYDPSGRVVGYDWAILRLYEPLGSWLGYFGYNGYSRSWNDEPYWSIIGYPGAVALGQRPSFQNGITIFDVDFDPHGGRELESRTADLTGGNSGGPMFGWWNGDPRVVGVVSGEEYEWWRWRNVMAAGSGFTDLIAWGRTNWPG